MAPNIVLFLTDQLRRDALGCYGNEICQTPNLDRLAEEGVRFDQAYTTSPVCSPARASLMRRPLSAQSRGDAQYAYRACVE